MFQRKKRVRVLSGELTEESLRQWLVEHLADRLDVPPETIDTGRTFEEYGLDSRVAVQMSGDLEKVAERRLSPGLLYEQPSIDDLVEYLTKEQDPATSGGAGGM